MTGRWGYAATNYVACFNIKRKGYRAVLRHNIDVSIDSMYERLPNLYVHYRAMGEVVTSVEVISTYHDNGVFWRLRPRKGHGVDHADTVGGSCFIAGARYLNEPACSCVGVNRPLREYFQHSSFCAMALWEAYTKYAKYLPNRDGLDMAQTLETLRLRFYSGIPDGMTTPEALCFMSQTSRIIQMVTKCHYRLAPHSESYKPPQGQ